MEWDGNRGREGPRRDLMPVNWFQRPKKCDASRKKKNRVEWEEVAIFQKCGVENGIKSGKGHERGII